MRTLLMIAALLAGPSAAAEPGQPVEVQLANFKFAPETIVLDHGKAYVLRLRNIAGGGHDFTAREFFAAAGVDQADRGWIKDGEIEVPAGETREIRLIAPAAGRYRLKCSHAFHKTLGMSGTILVR